MLDEQFIVEVARVRIRQEVFNRQNKSDNKPDLLKRKPVCTRSSMEWSVNLNCFVAIAQCVGRPIVYSQADKFCSLCGNPIEVLQQ